MHEETGDFYDYLTEHRYQLWRCSNCGTMKTLGEIRGDYYGAEYYGSSEGKFSWIIEKVFRLGHRLRASHFYQKFRPKSVLEVGCGRAYMLEELQGLGCEVYGLESDSAAEWILNNSKVSVYPIKNGLRWPIPDKSIDLVIVWHVLEHVNDPNAVMTEIKRVLSDRGVVCISVPNSGSLQARLSLAQWFHLDVPRHLYHFTKPGLSHLMANNGYQVFAYLNGDMMQNFYGWLQSLANLLTPRQNNLLYRFLQGGMPWKSCQNKFQLFWQLVGMPVILPVSIIGWAYESITKNAGTITLYAKPGDGSND